LTSQERRLFFEAITLIIFSTLCLKVIPFKRIYLYLDNRFGNIKIDFHDPNDGETAIVSRAISRGASVLPWKTLCLSKSISEFIMLRRRKTPATLCTGVKVLANSSLGAHAWVDTSGTKQTNANPDFVVVLKIGERT
jgi:hypothetical protein